MQPMEAPGTTTGPARWTRLAGLGLFMAGLAPLLMFLAGLIWGLEFEGDTVFFLIVSAIGLLGAFLVLRFGHTLWAKIIGIVASVLVAFAMFWTAFGLAYPGSFFDFIPGLLLLPGAIMGLVGSIAAIVASRRGRAAEAPAAGERKTVRAVMAIVGVLAVVSAVLTFVGSSSVDESEADETVTLSDFEFDSESYDFAAGTTVLVRNDDPFTHTFTVEELDIDETLTPGKEVLVEIPEESGEYVVFCRPHTSDPEEPSDDDMAADFNVQ
jgi:plastocyanin